MTAICTMRRLPRETLRFGSWLPAMRKLVVAASVLVIPLALLLFAQWPLRDWLQAHSRVANDLAQIVSALYAAIAITAASRSKSHLALVKYTQSATPSIAS